MSAPLIGWPLISRRSSAVSGPGLLEDTVVNEELADVVQERAGDDGTAVDVRELQPPGEPVRAGRDEDCVLVRVFPARFGRDDAARGRDRKGGFAVRV